MLPSRVSVVPARRAAQAVGQADAASIHTLIPLHHTHAQQRRQYAKRASPTRIGARPRPDDSMLFKPSDIPPVDLWRQFKTDNGLGDLTPEHCLGVVMNYCNVATNRNSAWKDALEKDYKIDLYTLHYAALPLVAGHDGTAGLMGLHMLNTASSLGYTPSTLTLVRMLARARKATLSKPAFRDTVARFERLLRTETNPDAFTLQGMLLQLQGQSDTYALRYFDKAIEAAGSRQQSIGDQSNLGNHGPPKIRKPRWSYEGSCHQKRGQILLQQGRTAEAMASFRIVALELNLADGYIELAKLLPLDAPERETYLLKAAQAGNLEACGLLALDMADKVSDSELRWEDRVHAGHMAREWALINPNFEKWEEVTEKIRAVTG